MGGFIALVVAILEPFIYRDEIPFLELKYKVAIFQLNRSTFKNPLITLWRELQQHLTQHTLVVVVFRVIIINRHSSTPARILAANAGCAIGV